MRNTCHADQLGGVDSHRRRNMVVLYADHHLVLHGQPGRLPHRRADDCAHRFGGRLGRPERDFLRNFRGWIYHDFLSGKQTSFLCVLTCFIFSHLFDRPPLSYFEGNDENENIRSISVSPMTTFGGLTRSNAHRLLLILSLFISLPFSTSSVFLACIRLGCRFPFLRYALLH